MVLSKLNHELLIRHRDKDIPTYLLFNGLDTFTSIELCGKHVASTNNQFRQYSFDVSDILSSCPAPATSEPRLSISFGSAINISQTIADEPGQETWPWTVEGLYEFPNRQFVRKEQSDFGWDWGPAFAPAGIWQPAWVVQLPQGDAYVKNTLLDIHREGQLNNLPPDQNANWVVDVSLDFLGHLPTTATLSLSILSTKNNQTIAKVLLQNITRTESSIGGSIVVDAETFQLWWPIGLGEQNLYYFKIIIVDGGKTLASVTKRSGFRTIVLNMQPVSEEQIERGIAPGNNWHFEVNGKEFYAKGSNFVS